MQLSGELTSALICLERHSAASQEDPLLLDQSKPRANPLPESIAQSTGRTTGSRRSITQSQGILVLPVLIFFNHKYQQLLTAGQFLNRKAGMTSAL